MPAPDDAHLGPAGSAHTGPAGWRDRVDGPVVARFAAVAVVMLVAVAVVVATALPARAHASLTASQPVDGALLTASPEVVSFTFNEEVEATTGSLRVFDATGTRVDDGVLDHPTSNRVAVGVGDLAEGGHVATYRVTSADGHVIRGAVTFSVGAGTALDDDTVAALFAADDAGLGVVSTVVRAIDLGAALVAIGSLATVFGVVATRRHRRVARGTAHTAARIGLAAAALTVPLQAMAASGLGVAALGSGQVWSDTITSTVGVGALTRVAGLVLVLAMVGALARAPADGHGADRNGTDRDGVPGRPVHGTGISTLVGAAVLVLGSLLVDGHTRTVGPVAVMVFGDAVHLVAGAIWAGGLVVLARILRASPGPTAADVGVGVVRTATRDAPGSHDPALRVSTTRHVAVRTGGPGGVRDHDEGPPPDDPGGLAATVATWSGWALWSMFALVVAGSAMGWALVREPRALTSTDQGWTLVTKGALVGVILVIAAWNRWRLVPAVVGRGADAGAATRALRVSMAVEVGVLVVVLGVTAVLVTLRPAAAEAGISGAFDTDVALGDDATMNLVVDPNRAGANEVHVYVFDDTGRPLAEADDLRLQLRQVDQDIGPLERTPLPAGPGHWVLSGSDLVVPGRWEITTIVGLDRFTQVQATVEVVVNPR